MDLVSTIVDVLLLTEIQQIIVRVIYSIPPTNEDNIGVAGGGWKSKEFALWITFFAMGLPTVISK